LSKISGLFVIAWNSAFAYKGQTVDIGEVSRKLGVQYVLEGSVRKAGKRVRINAQLINATTGGHEWAERYDRELEDIFAVQDEMTHRIAFALKVTLTPEEQARFRQAPTTNLDAYDCYLRGSEVSNDFTQERNTRARQLFEQAISLDPDYAAAYASLGMAHWTDWSHQWSPNSSQALEQAFELAQKAVALDNSLPVAHRILGFVSLWRKDHAHALAEGEQAVALGPSDAESLGWLGDILNFIFIGRPEDGLKMIEQSIRLNPHHPVYYNFWRAHAYYLMEQYEQAITAAKSVLMLNPSILPAHMYLTASSSEDGREEEARAAATAFRRCLPQVSVQFLEQVLPDKDPTVTTRLLTALRKAGME
jgi:adenylate cyclase